MTEINQSQQPFSEKLSQLSARVAELEQQLSNKSAFLDNLANKNPRFYQTLLENLPNSSLYVFDENLRYVLADGAGLTKPKEILEGKFVKEVVTPQNYDLIAYHYNLALQGQEMCFELTHNNKSFLTRVRPLRGKQGHIVGGVAVVQDITEQKRANEMLQQSEARYRIISEMTSDFVWAAHTDSSSGQALVDWVTDAVKDITGYSQTEFAALSGLGGICLQQDLPTLLNFRQQVLNGKEKTVEFECRIVCKNKEIRWLRILGRSAVDILAQPKGLIAAAKDITEQKRAEAQKETLEKQLQIMDKLESLGVMAGGLAHDFNNLLTIIMGNLSLAQTALDTLPKEQDVVQSLQEAEKASMRAINLTQQLLTFSKGGAPVRKTAQLNEIIEDSARFMVSGSRVSLVFNIAPDLWAAEVDTGQLSQVIQNLIINAVQAMPNGGKIQVSAYNITFDREEVATVKAGSYVKISVEDEGVGISSENQTKIFDPFFTTKSNGNGLGLATVFSIIRGHEGHIEVESQLGVGTRFIIYLPAAPQSQRDKSDIASITLTTTTDKGRILVMDDEPAIRQFLNRALTRLGYSCEVTSDGSEALRLYNEAMTQGQPFAAVILDLTVPNGMGGEETATRILNNDPKAKIIVSSGYSDSSIMANYQEYNISGVISKPYQLKNLQEVLERVILYSDKSQLN